jgi:hypothetical protein
MSNANLLDLPSIQCSRTPSPHASNSTNEPEPEGVQQSEDQDLIQRTTLIIDSLSGDMEKDLAIIREKLAPLICKMEGALPEYFIDKIKKKTGLSKGALREEIKRV